MEQEMLEMAAQWKKTALEELAKCKPSTRVEFANQMLLVCAEMLEYKLTNLTADDSCLPRTTGLTWPSSQMIMRH